MVRNNQPQLKSLYVASLDYDGCLANSYSPDVDSSDPNSIVNNNKILLSTIINSNNTESFPVTLMVGSLRQDLALNRINQSKNQNGCCFKAMNALANHPDYKKYFYLDKYLLADTDFSYPHGHYFNLAIDESIVYHYYSKQHRSDPTKKRLLYAQMHKIASENPKTNITFDFYDDKLNILRDLDNYFNVKHPELRPHNVKFNCKQWKLLDKKIVNISSAQLDKPGGAIDFNYEKNIKLMANLSPLKKATATGILIDLMNVQEFIAKRDMTASQSSPPLPFFNSHTLFQGPYSSKAHQGHQIPLNQQRRRLSVVIP